MRHYPARFFPQIFVFFLLATPACLPAQTPGGAPAAAERGWGSAWLVPANEQQRKQQELLGKIKAAQQAHDVRTELALCDQFVALTPKSTAPYFVRAVALGRAKQFDRAMEDLNKAQEIARTQQRTDESATILRVRALLHSYQKDYPAAANDLQASLRLNARNEQTLNSLAWLRATAPDASVRNGPEGVRLAQKAISLSRRETYVAVDTLAAAYAESNEYPRAIDSEKRALSAAEKEIKDAATAQKFRQAAAERLALFEQHRAYHAELP